MHIRICKRINNSIVCSWCFISFIKAVDFVIVKRKRIREQLVSILPSHLIFAHVCKLFHTIEVSFFFLYHLPLSLLLLLLLNLYADTNPHIQCCVFRLLTDRFRYLTLFSNLKFKYYSNVKNFFFFFFISLWQMWKWHLHQHMCNVLSFVI